MLVCLSLMFGLSVKMRSFKPKSSGLLPGVLRSENLDTSGNLGKLIPLKQLGERVLSMFHDYIIQVLPNPQTQIPNTMKLNPLMISFHDFSHLAQHMYSHFLPHPSTSRYAFSNAAFAGAGSKNHAPAFTRCRRLAPRPLPHSCVCFSRNGSRVSGSHRVSVGDAWDHEY